jgi:GntR family transcriptional regulator of arabinose operon
MSKPTLLNLADSGEAQPKHERLHDYLVQEMKQGRLRPGEALPTETELAISAEMSRNTVRQALGQLERNGMIRRVRGRGTFVHESAMQRLKSGLDIFALVIPETRNGYYPSLQRGFHQASGMLQNQVIICDTDNDQFRQADALLQLIDKKVAGVALVPTTIPPTPAHQIRPLHDRGIPVVFCHRRVEGIQAPLVTFSGLEVGRRAGSAMAECGHRRVAFFSGQRAGLSGQYEQGLREAIKENGGELPEAFVRYDSITKITADHEKFVKSNLEDILGQPSPPTAIFCAFDSEAELVYVLLGQMGIKVPEEISVVGFGGSWREGAITRRLTSVTVDEEELGRQAAKLLSEMRYRDRPINDVTDILLPLNMSDGETLGPRLSHERQKSRK